MRVGVRGRASDRDRACRSAPARAWCCAAPDEPPSMPARMLGTSSVFVSRAPGARALLVECVAALATRDDRRWQRGPLPKPRTNASVGIGAGRPCASRTHLRAVRACVGGHCADSRPFPRFHRPRPGRHPALQVGISCRSEPFVQIPWGTETDAATAVWPSRRERRGGETRKYIHTLAERLAHGWPWRGEPQRTRAGLRARLCARVHAMGGRRTDARYGTSAHSRSALSRPCSCRFWLPPASP